MRVRCGPQGQLTNTIATAQGEKQGCILAPLLFNVYIKSVTQHHYNSNFHPPKLADIHFSVLLYADGMLILSLILVRM